MPINYWVVFIALELIAGLMLLNHLDKVDDRRRKKHEAEMARTQVDHEQQMKRIAEEVEPQSIADIVRDIKKTRKETIQLLNEGTETACRIVDLLKQNTETVFEIHRNYHKIHMDHLDDVRYQSALDSNARRKKLGQPPRYNPTTLWQLKNAKNIREAQSKLH